MHAPAMTLLPAHCLLAVLPLCISGEPTDEWYGIAGGQGPEAVLPWLVLADCWVAGAAQAWGDAAPDQLAAAAQDGERRAGGGVRGSGLPSRPCVGHCHCPLQARGRSHPNGGPINGCLYTAQVPREPVPGCAVGCGRLWVSALSSHMLVGWVRTQLAREDGSSPRGLCGFPPAPALCRRARQRLGRRDATPAVRQAP